MRLSGKRFRDIISALMRNTTELPGFVVPKEWPIISMDEARRLACELSDEEFAAYRDRVGPAIWPGMVAYRRQRELSDPYVWVDAFADCPR